MNRCVPNDVLSKIAIATRRARRYPCQEHVGGDSKIPTIIYYDEAGNAQAIGAEADGDGINDRAEEDKWTKAEW